MTNPKRSTAFLAFAVTVAALLAATCPAVADDAEGTDVKAGEITLHVPATWKHEETKSRLRLTQFRIPAAEGDKEDAELAVFSFGAGGGIEANVRRWIGQFQAEGREAKVFTGKTEQGPYVLVEISGTYKKPIGPPIAGKTKDAPGSRALSVILAVPEKGNYFLKLTGPDKTVAAQSNVLRESFGGDPKEEKELKLDQ